MATPTIQVISGVSDSLKSWAQAAAAESPGLPGGQDAIDVVSFFDAALPAEKVLLTLYELEEDPYTRNRPPVRTDVDSKVELARAPVGVVLRFLLCPTFANLASVELALAKFLRAQAATPVLSGEQLKGDLAGTDESIRLTLLWPSLDDRTKLWQALQQRFRVALYLEARVVNVPIGLKTRTGLVGVGRLAPAPDANGGPGP